jgi:uncharacterized membrane protein YqaE (UPF0057 family)
VWTVFLIILAIFVPPLSVFLISGIGKDFWINLILTFFFWAPGVVHGIFLIVTRS